MIHYDFDESDWIAIDQGYGYGRTDSERNLWFTYPLMGEPPLEIRLAQEPMAAPVMVQVMATQPPPESLAIQIDTTMTIFNSFHLRLPGGS